jgi:ADP-heptose:LPS heptosyltransferase
MRFLFKINKFLPYFKKKSNLQCFEKILVVSNTGLGDTILSTPAIITLKKSFPDKHITFMIHKKIFPLFKGFEYVDDFEIYKSGFFNQISIVLKLRKKQIDTIFLFHSNGPEDIFFSILSGASNIFKMTDNLDHEFKQCFSNIPNSRNQHDIEKKLDLVRSFRPKFTYKKLHIPEYFYKNAGFFEKDKGSIHIGLQLGAQENYKIWPINNFVKLATKLCIERNKFKFILLGATKNEIRLAEEFCHGFNNPKSIVNLCGKSLIDELPTIVNDLDLLVTNDTGTMHLAIALGVKTISLFGPTNPSEFGPYQDFIIHRVVSTGNPRFVQDRQIDFKSLNLIENIGVDQVYSEINEAIRC